MTALRENDTPLTLVTEANVWPERGGGDVPRASNAFGFGGANSYDLTATSAYFVNRGARRG